MTTPNVLLKTLTMFFRGQVQIDLPRFFTFCPVSYPGVPVLPGSILSAKIENSFRGIDDGKNSKTFPHTCDFRIYVSREAPSVHFSFHINPGRKHQTGKICGAKNHTNTEAVVKIFFEKILYLQEKLEEIKKYPEEFNELLKFLSKNLIVQKKFCLRRPNLTPKRLEKSGFFEFAARMECYFDTSFSSEKEIRSFVKERLYEKSPSFLDLIDIRSTLKLETSCSNRFLSFVQPYFQDAYESPAELCENLQWFTQANSLIKQELQISKIYPVMIICSYHLPFLLHFVKFRNYINQLFEEKIQDTFYVFYVEGVPCIVEAKIPGEERKIVHIVLGLDLKASITKFNILSSGFSVLPLFQSLLNLMKPMVNELALPDTI